MARSTASRATALLAALPAALAATTVTKVPAAAWAPVNKVASGTPLTMSLLLSMQNIDSLESQLLSLSTPGSPNYGKYLNNEQVAAQYGPSANSVAAVKSWLSDAGIDKYNVDGLFVDFSADVDTVNSLFKANYQHFAYNGQTKVRTTSYTLPDAVENHIALVDPGVYFGTNKAFRATPTAAKGEAPVAVRRAASSVSVAASCQTSITPACLKQLYNIGNYTASPGCGSKLGFGSFLNQSALYADQAQFETLNGIPPQNFTTILVAGGVDDQNPADKNYGEANLDAQNQVGIAHPLRITQYITGGSPPFVENIDQPTPADNQNEPYLPYYRYLLSQPTKSLPQVISNSYGDEEDSVPEDYAVTTCNLIAMLGLQGITVIESSGDLGVGAGCLAPDNKTVEFNAIFPATCPYLTSIGGTVAVTPEIAWKGSSGGFSKYFARPPYQEEAVAAYKALVPPETLAYYSNYTNFAGRGFPDVSAHSVSPDYQVVYAGRLAGSGGTSAAAPVWAGVVALLNDARIRRGLPTLGFLNPLIYAGGYKALTDITGGYSVGCNGQNTQSGGAEPPGSGIVPYARWNATAGWDPVTGYGTPDFQALKSYVLSV